MLYLCNSNVCSTILFVREENGWSNFYKDLKEAEKFNDLKVKIMPWIPYRVPEIGI